jgi:hypothetical protein
MPDREWTTTLRQNRPLRISELCKAEDRDTQWYRHWCNELQEEPRYHRKQWEYVYILQALFERGCIEKGKRGMVFAVGTEPLPSLFAKHGCSILATDIFPEQGMEKGWGATDQLCFGIDSLNSRKLVTDAELRQLVTYRPVDMNNIPPDIYDYDFNWSSCSFEHLGTIEKGLAFLRNQLKTLRSGGWAVHTTEYNISSDDQTQDNNDTVIFRQQDINRVVAELRAEGHYVERIDYSLGGMPEDYAVDVFPHEQKVHLKLQVGEYIVTSIGLIIRKK